MCRLCLAKYIITDLVDLGSIHSTVLNTRLVDFAENGASFVDFRTLLAVKLPFRVFKSEEKKDY